jgi:NifU-like protein involved in Fe-S cluster formation
MGRFSEVLMDHFNSPRNSGVLEAPDRIGRAGAAGQGPYLTLYLKLDGQVIAAARFQTYGCGASIAAGSMLTEMVIGRSVADCLALTADQLSEALGGFPPDKLHCPIMAVTALRDALDQGPGESNQSTGDAGPTSSG